MLFCNEYESIQQIVYDNADFTIQHYECSKRPGVVCIAEELAYKRLSQLMFCFGAETQQ